MLDNERSSAISQDEGIEEKLSLSDRFGLWISFHNLDKSDFILIIKNYCKFYNINFDEEIESIRSFDINSQLSLETFKHFCIIPNVQEQLLLESQESFLNYLPSKTIIWIKNIKLSKSKGRIRIFIRHNLGYDVF